MSIFFLNLIVFIGIASLLTLGAVWLMEQDYHF